MKTIFTIIGIFILIFIILYLAISFVYLEINFANWSQSNRIILVAAGFIISTMITIAYIATKDY